MEKDLISAVWPQWHTVRRIGGGAYGTVYEAEKTGSVTDHHSAVKVISVPRNKSELDALLNSGISEIGVENNLKEIVQSFTREIQTLEKFKGLQNIVSIEDYAVEEKQGEIGWDIFIRMELLTPLNAYISNHKMSEKEVLKLGIDLCSALERCAVHNVIHRDIKPANIFINDFGDFKLGDFGIARRLDHTASDLTQIGTSTYMAPEVAKTPDYDARVDLYSLGLVLHWLLNQNRPPFIETNDPTLNELEDANRRRLGGKPLPVPCDASPKAAEAILRACEPDPNNRYATAAEMKRALRAAWEATKDVNSPPPDPSNTSDSSGSSDRGGNRIIRKAVIAAVLAVLLIGGGFFAAPKLMDSNIFSGNHEIAASNDAAKSGECGKDGNNILWSLEKNGELRISGTGETISLADEDAPPWKEYLEKIRSIVVEDGITHIGVRLFRGCEKAKSVQLPDSLVSIGALAFRDCTYLTEITIPAGVTSIHETAFHNCDSFDSHKHMLHFQVDPKNNSFIVKDGILYSADGTTLFHIPADTDGTFVVPAGVTKISKDAFCGSGIESVVIHSAVTVVEPYAFDNCLHLESIVVDSANQTLSSINNVLFDRTQKVLLFCPPELSKSFIIPPTVQEVRRTAFSDTSLSSVTFPESVKKIEDSLCSGAKEDIELVFQGDAPEMDPEAFFDTDEITITIVYDASRNGWDELKSAFDSNNIIWQPVS